MLAPEETTGIMTRLSFLTVALWWFVFTIPLLRVVPEPPRRIAGRRGRAATPSWSASPGLPNTFREITRFRDLFIFLVAFWFYNDGIGTIIKMATIYGAEIGIGQTTLIGTLLLVQFVGIPFAFLFGWLANKIGTTPIDLHQPAGLHRHRHRRLFPAKRMAVLGAGHRRRHRPGRQPGPLPLAVRPHGSAQQIRRVLRLLQRL